MPSDAEAISSLITGTAHYFTLHPKGEGAGAFMQTIAPSAIASYICAENFSYFVGLVDDQLAGVVALRGNTHLYHLFVAQAFQGQGYATQLWQHAKQYAIEAGNDEGFTVNSTSYAMPIYERFGFKAMGAQVETMGIAFVPMAFSFDSGG